MESFRLQDRGDVVIIHVADTVPAMRAAIRSFAGDDDPAIEQLAAVCYGVSGRGRQADVVAVVFLARPLVGAGLVAHELTHATLRIFERRGWRLRHGPRVGGRSLARRHETTEEQFCLVVEALTREFWTRWFAWCKGGQS